MIPCPPLARTLSVMSQYTLEPPRVRVHARGGEGGACIGEMNFANDRVRIFKDAYILFGPMRVCA